MTEGFDHVLPRSVVRANIAGPKAGASGSSSGGSLKRTHVTYALFGFVGSAVIVSLSLEINGSPSSSIAAVTGPQVAPPSCDVLITTAEFSSPKASALSYTSPFGAMLTQGLVMRSKSPPLAALPPVQWENGGGAGRLQVRPKSLEIAVR